MYVFINCRFYITIKRIYYIEFRIQFNCSYLYNFKRTLFIGYSFIEFFIKSLVKFQIENYVFHKVYLLNFFIISFTIDYIINKIKFSNKNTFILVYPIFVKMLNYCMYNIFSNKKYCELFILDI
ncbi:hypothetical protein QQO_1367 [Clostridioides difficile P3]|nr:hypothetical protein QC7_1426 [Clostridioides difficile CD38]EQI13224.1 hypothetical protein QOI_1295 [Clostridioides difficile Y21]EQI93283.1 hypothetical protein QQO_1367 [Clostridioides difficile P3]EQK20564.1 hypothetical protein QUW_1313 [Clostridioides difficile P72]EQK40729.1 hypothetical protein QW7_1474 [Clostridioides difficile P77]